MKHDVNLFQKNSVASISCGIGMEFGGYNFVQGFCCASGRINASKVQSG